MSFIALAKPLAFSVLCALLLTNSAAAQRSPFSGDKRTAIKETDLKRDLFAIGGDHFRGREGGTLDVSFDAGKIHVFDAETGAALR